MADSNDFFVRDRETTAIIAELESPSIYKGCIKNYLEKMENLQASNKKENENKEFFQVLDLNVAMEEFILTTLFQAFREQKKEELESQTQLKEKYEAVVEKWKADMNEAYKPLNTANQQSTTAKMDTTIQQIDQLIEEIKQAAQAQQHILDDKLDTWKATQWTEEKVSAIAKDAYEKSGLDANVIFGNDPQAQEQGKAALIESAEKSKALTDMLKNPQLSQITEDKAALLQKNDANLSAKDAYIKAVQQEVCPRANLMAHIRVAGALKKTGKSTSECLKIATGLREKEEQKLVDFIQKNPSFVEEAKNYKESNSDKALMAEADSMFGNLFLDEEKNQQLAKLDYYNLFKKSEIDKFRHTSTDQLYSHQHEAIANRAQHYEIQMTAKQLVNALETTLDSVVNSSLEKDKNSTSANALDIIQQVTAQIKTAKQTIHELQLEQRSVNTPK